MEYSELSPDVLAITGNVPLPTLIRNIRNVTIQFCKETRTYTTTPPELILTDNTATFTPPTDTRIWGAEYLNVTGSIRSSFFEFDEGSQVFTLPHTVKQGDVAKAKLVLIPTRTSTQCSDNVMEPHYMGIVAGAIANILMMRNETWYDPNLAQAYAASFQQAMDDATHRRRNDDREGVRVSKYGGL